ncbi:DUF2892 domain-containing protein [Salinadaptatus halalkaliphilus]|uniref:DUF2892 domain-containing protein n=2 Tax=Salinadaptatus halalkaliphilus TaxID=2419781 RepID=A0A4S3TPP9_9EURY|nr:DUF2892 domain-containing protein [Salinadaptatus halalkaliphilus]THE65203.1 DUF2892 domain-containing protein [Salinadaptatus halalkaliphilus]
MHTNLDQTGRIARGIVGIWLVAIAISAYRAKQRTTAVIAGIVGLGFVQNAVIGYCGGNRLFGIDTTADE